MEWVGFVKTELFDVKNEAGSSLLPGFLPSHVTYSSLMCLSWVNPPILMQAKGQDKRVELPNLRFSISKLWAK